MNLRKVMVLTALVVIITVIVTALTLTLRHSSINYMVIHAQYVFLVPGNGGKYELEYYCPNGDLNVLGTYSVLSNGELWHIRMMIKLFNWQYSMEQAGFIPLSYFIVIGGSVITNSTGVIVIPVRGDTILLNKLNGSDYEWTVIVTVPQYTQLLMNALGTGYRKAVLVSGTSSLWKQQPIGSLLGETYNFEEFIGCGGGYVIVTCNGTIIPFGYVCDEGNFLPFIAQANDLPFTYRAVNACG